MKQKLIKYAVLLLIIFFSKNIYATHIRAGEIVTERISSTTLQYRIVVYIYTSSATGVNAQSADIDLEFGDGTVMNIQRDTPAPINVANETQLNTYTTTYTYSSPGSYRVRFVEDNRNGGVVNMTNSVNTPFSVETWITINAFIGLNTSPQLSVIPLDLACVGQRFIHNPGAFDVDGDSLAFRLIVPWKDFDTNVDGYADPASFGGMNEDGTGPSTFSIDSITGDLVWDAPPSTGLGEYNIAFMIEEWRNGVLIGYLVRDMQIVVVDCQNERPDIDPLPDTCVVAGDLINKTIRAVDPDGHQIRLSAPQFEFNPRGGVFGNPFNATFSRLSTDAPEDSPAAANFQWQTECSFIREEPYIIVFKAEDEPPPPAEKLADIKSWLVRVVGPAPTNLTATPNGTSMILNWDAYSCPNAEEIVICRKIGCNNPDPQTCELGCPEGYEEIARVPANETTFTDMNLARGPIYSYRIHATFANSEGGGLGYASEEACEELLLDVPIITNVSIESTDTNNGEIYVRWVSPIDLDIVTFSPPYRYRVFRAEGINGTNFTQVHTVTATTVSPILTYEYTDVGLNTEDNAYSYRVVLDYGASETFKDSSDIASSVRLTASSAPCGVQLNWEYNVPWSNANQEHKIFRQNDAGIFELVQEHFVGSSQYKDDGGSEQLAIGTEFCYYIETVGTYGNPRIPIEPIENKSQIDCGIPVDETAPNPPILAIDTLVCPQVDKLDCQTNGCVELPLENNLSWIKGALGDCEDDIQFYRLYYRPTTEGDFSLLADNITNLNFIHTNPNQIGDIISQAGCYVVTAVDFAGNESEFSNVVCQDNCTYYKLPNVLTPNEDGDNDILTPCPEPCFVEKVDFKLYDRYGVLVHEENNDILINWNPPANISNGVYFYSAEVTFVTVNVANRTQTIQGWITILK